VSGAIVSGTQQKEFHQINDKILLSLIAAHAPFCLSEFHRRLSLTSDRTRPCLRSWIRTESYDKLSLAGRIFLFRAPISGIAGDDTEAIASAPSCIAVRARKGIINMMGWPSMIFTWIRAAQSTGSRCTFSDQRPPGGNGKNKTSRKFQKHNREKRHEFR
jgi:hypothetical protein